MINFACFLRLSLLLTVFVFSVFITFRVYQKRRGIKMLSRSSIDKINGNVSEPNFWKFPCQGNDWKAEYMRIIPEEFIRSTKGAFDHRVVCSVSWGNSWQFWLEREKEGLIILKEDWDEFVDTNHLGSDDVMIFEHEETMFLQVRFFKKDGKEVISAPEPETETETEPVQNSRQETAPAFASTSGGTKCRARKDSGDVKNPEQYLLNPKNPYFVKTLTQKNDVLYVSRMAIQKYGLKFGPTGSAMSYLLPEGKEEGKTKIYGSGPCFNGWAALCRKYDLKTGDSVVCELELSEGVVAAVRLHLVKKLRDESPL